MFRCLAPATLTLLLVGCSEPAGTYVTTPESLRTAFEATYPSDPELRAQAQARLELENATREWSITLDLHAEGWFELKMDFSLRPRTSTGTWKLEGDSIVMTESDTSEQWVARWEGDRVVLRQGAHDPEFVMFRQ